MESTQRPSSPGETQPEHERPVGAPPPGQFVSTQHATDCSRFLEEIKNVVRHRSEAGLGPDR